MVLDIHDLLNVRQSFTRMSTFCQTEMRQGI